MKHQYGLAAFALASSCFIQGHAFAADLFAGYFLVPDKSSLGAMFIECQQPDRKGEMTCSFTDVDIRHKVPDKVSPADRGALAQQLFGDPIKSTALCAHLPIPDVEAPATTIRFQAAMRKVCSRRDDASINEFFEAGDAMEAATCKIGTVGSYQSKFRATTENATSKTWVSTNGPDGSCGVVTVESLETDKTKQLDWTYRKQQNVTRPEGDAQCETLRTSPQTYRWLTESRPAKCEYVIFQPTFLP